MGEDRHLCPGPATESQLTESNLGGPSKNLSTMEKSTGPESHSQGQRLAEGGKACAQIHTYTSASAEKALPPCPLRSHRNKQLDP